MGAEAVLETVFDIVVVSETVVDIVVVAEAVVDVDWVDEGTVDEDTSDEDEEEDEKDVVEVAADKLTEVVLDATVDAVDTTTDDDAELAGT